MKLKIAEAKKRTEQLKQEKNVWSYQEASQQENQWFQHQPAEPAPKAKAAPIDPSDLRIFVKNLRPETTEQSLKAYFNRWGKVVDVFIRQSGHNFSGVRCAMGYITFSSYYGQNPLSVLHIIDGMTVPVHKVQVKNNPKHETVQKSRTLMISGAIHDLADIDLITYFGKFGNVAKVIRKPDPKNVGKFQRFAFLGFQETSAVDKAVAVANHVVKGQMVDVRRVKDVKM